MVDSTLNAGRGQRQGRVSAWGERAPWHMPVGKLLYRRDLQIHWYVM